MLTAVRSQLQNTSDSLAAPSWAGPVYLSPVASVWSQSTGLSWRSEVFIFFSGFWRHCANNHFLSVLGVVPGKAGFAGYGIIKFLIQHLLVVVSYVVFFGRSNNNDLL
jgi:hypothetical protein